jgi:integrase
LKSRIAKDQECRINRGISNAKAKTLKKEQRSKKENLKDYLRVWDALIGWRDHIYKKEFLKVSKQNYILGLVKLIEKEIIDPKEYLINLSQNWLEQKKTEVKEKTGWSKATQYTRISCLISFFEFATEVFKPDPLHPWEGIPYSTIPTIEMIPHLLTSVEDKARATELTTEQWMYFFEKIAEKNLRDYLIATLIVFSGRPLESVLDLKRAGLKEFGIIFEKEEVSVPNSLIKQLHHMVQDNPPSEYLFVTKSGQRIRRNQILRSLKSASKAANLPTEVSAKVLLSAGIAFIELDKRTLLSKVLANTIFT